MEWILLVIGLALVAFVLVVGTITKRVRTGGRPQTPPVGPGAGTDVLAPPAEVDVDTGPEAPVLAELVGPPQRRGNRHGWVAADVAEAAMHVELVAVAAGVQQVRLMALDRQVDLSNLVQILK